MSCALSTVLLASRTREAENQKSVRRGFSDEPSLLVIAKQVEIWYNAPRKSIADEFTVAIGNGRGHLWIARTQSEDMSDEGANHTHRTAAG